MEQSEGTNGIMHKHFIGLGMGSYSSQCLGRSSWSPMVVELSSELGQRCHKVVLSTRFR